MTTARTNSRDSFRSTAILSGASSISIRITQLLNSSAPGQDELGFGRLSSPAMTTNVQVAQRARAAEPKNLRGLQFTDRALKKANPCVTGISDESVRHNRSRL